MEYDLKPMRAPRTSGALLGALARVVEHPVGGALVGSKLLAQVGVEALRAARADDPPYEPGFLHPGEGEARLDIEVLEGLRPGPGFAFATAADYVAAYRSGTVRPEDVAARVLEMVAQSEGRTPPMRLLIAQNKGDLLEQAQASGRRYEEGHPLGPLDGVPVAVKDELDQVPYPTTVGTRFLGVTPADRDAEAVARLRAAGALLIGKANMHEIGLGVSGINPHHGTARNPYHPGHMAGGSSSGPAAVVGAGLCPLAVGADGGGSIRIPAAFCGVVGLKPTFGRVSERGAAPLCWSLAHVGPLGATVADVALAYALMAGPDPADPHTLGQPRPTLRGLGQTSLGGIRLGIYTPWFEDADREVVQACRRMVGLLKEGGAQVHEVSLAELGLLRTVHLVTIVSEIAASQLGEYHAHQQDYSLEARMNLALGRRLSSFDYVHAQRLRTRLCRRFAQVLGQVDALVTPATGCVAPLLPEEALSSGESNLELTTKIMRFAQAGNLTGYPTISFPVGYDGQGLPIGLQVMARPWEEDLLLRIAFEAERHLERQGPRVLLDPLRA